MESYEFNQDENKEFLSLSRVLKLASLSFFCLSGVSFFSAFVSNDTSKLVLFLVPGILFLLTGIWSYSAGISFKRITDTKGEDLDFLRIGLRSLRIHFWIQISFGLFAILFLLGGAVLTLVS
ncbi:hypothetical protein [Leptospira kmetyi]|uniref:Uncharacterized protein n=1 Tax=Leptospira kmetyi TaxID=408139 RepID=A0A2M9XMK5_9LEPT|nr:hypothetical protein [Leptospira kmetyi]AYV54286.1 hypothetical protein EFP84_01390 [Leptospira kmetyi]EQA53850.1 hypothetical protein LEP1GSC052_1305 [Leptospira kmetyi serovar Malaysia str. Bejo-Iso9]PJZ28631.1 hypothetical protein CH378_16845 [Leptospira kmetyi]PJZ40426.1 hypothetical protein CH370_16070 [Leptospira kmetyi]TGK22628.1 hypothetical protein EHO62_02215 [Leptospira kmetyi]